MIPARYSEKIIDSIDKLVNSGFYRSRSDALRDAARRLIREQYGLLKNFEKNKSSVELVREIRKQIWEEALAKTDGDESKAARLIAKEANEIVL